MLGGFLGAGKTTTIARLARHFGDRDERVGLVTNDQAHHLVDTQTLRSQGFDVGEVPGACFCCRFDDLIQTVKQLTENQVPDWVIAEPVGSCTDLYATVIQPMRELFGEQFEPGPLVVLLKPEHGRKILGLSKRRGFSPQAEYIFLKQLEEADVIAINKIDRLDADPLDALVTALSQRFPETPILAFSARTGRGFEAIVQAVHSMPRSRTRAMEVDYEIYAAGEAELGWMNCQLSAQATIPFRLDDLVVDLVRWIGDDLTDANQEIAHLKILAQTLQDTAVANRVDSAGKTELSLASQIETTTADVLVNARVATSPDQLTAAVDRAIERMARERSIAIRLIQVQSFRPAKPEPTHRMTLDGPDSS